MPELPEVQIVVDGINANVCGREITGIDIHWPGYLDGVTPKSLRRNLTGQQMRTAERRGKFILIHLDSHSLLNHLRMTGKIVLLDRGVELPAHTHVVFHLEGGTRLGFSDTRKFGRLKLMRSSEVENTIESLRLGLEPFAREFNGGNLADLFARRKKPIKNVLLDQTMIAGIGNIYASEILFSSRVNPLKPAGEIGKKEITRIIRSTRRVLREAIRRGGSSVSDYVQVNGQTGSMQDHFNVYGRAGEPCIACGKIIIRETLAGRGTYWCGSCQPYKKS